MDQLSLFDYVEDAQIGTSYTNLYETLKISNVPGWPDRFGRLLNEWALKTIEKPIRTLSIFSGGGGLDIGFHDVGFDVLTMIEIEEKFVRTLQANSGDDRYFGPASVCCMDIRDFAPAEDMDVDFVIGGPPCQTFSAASRRAAGVLGTTDERGILFEEYVRLLTVLQPKGFLFENVYGITGAQDGTAWREITDAFLRAGYKIFHRVLDAADYGVPQHRERLFIVGVQEGEYQFPSPTHGPDSPDNYPFYTAKEAVEGIEDPLLDTDKGIGGKFGHLLADIPPGLNYSFYTEKMGHPQPLFAWRSKFSDFLYKADPNTPVRTIKAQGGQYTGPFHWKNRPFSVNELKRLQTIPDCYDIVGNKQVAIKQIGNSVPSQIARILALSILEQIFGSKIPLTLPLLDHSKDLGFRKRKRQLTKIYQEKARKAIAQQIRSPKSLPVIRREYTACLSENFAWTERAGILSTCGVDPNSLEVSFMPQENEWQIYVADSKSDHNAAFTIDVYPSPHRPWKLPVDRVRLIGQTLSFNTFTSLWKAFEAELVTLNIKADLVQLSGYYQYTPKIFCKFTLTQRNISTEWNVLKHVVEGIGVRAIESHSSLGQMWQIDSKDVIKMAKHLKKIGYEVRNKNTNPQIPLDHILIPYAFPTLNPMSVQFKKSLS